ncbi:MAG: hypothetical protein R2771_13565 [Saprospiraceae bacterium]
MLRKDFLRSSILGIAGAMIPKNTSKASSTVNLKRNLMPDALPVGFIAESGIYGKDETSFIGILIAKNHEVHENNIRQLRSQLNFKSKLIYYTNDKYKAPFVQNILDYFMNNSDLSFIFKKVQFTQLDGPNNYSFSKLSYQKIDLYKELMTQLPTDKIPDQLIVKYQSLNGPNSIFTDAFSDKTDKSISATITRDSNLLQLSSFLCGTMASYIINLTQSTVKRGSIAELKSKLGINDFNSNLNSEKIIIK